MKDSLPSRASIIAPLHLGDPAAVMGSEEDLSARHRQR